MTGCSAASFNHTAPKDKARTPAQPSPVMHGTAEPSLFSSAIKRPFREEQNEVFVEANEPVLHQLEGNAHDLHPNDDVEGEEQEEVRVF